MGKKFLDECHPDHLWYESIFHGATGVAFEVYRAYHGVLRDSLNAMRMSSARSVGLYIYRYCHARERVCSASRQDADKDGPGC